MTTDEPRCPICSKREPAEGMVIDRVCMDRIDDDLARIVELTRLAAGWLAPRNGSGTTTRAVPGSRPPVDLASLDAALGNDVLPLLESWVRLLREEAGLAPYGLATEGRNVTVGLLVPWLRSWLAWAAERPDFPIEDMAREIRDARWTLERLDPDHDRPDGMRVPCPAPHPDHDGRGCGYRLAVVMDRAADDIPCPRCGETWSGNRLILVALSDPAVTVWAYPDVIEAIWAIPARTLRDWAAKGYVARQGNRYDVGACYRRRMSA